MAYFWIWFHAVVLGLIYLDVKVFHRGFTKPKITKSLYFAVFWIGIAFLFGAGVALVRGYNDAIAFFTAYVLEASLSLDNLFVFLSIFSFLRIPFIYQHRVLFYGILGALVFRIICILVGISLVERFFFLFYVFGAVLCATAIFLYRQKEEAFANNWMVRFAHRFFPLKEGLFEGKFFVKEGGKWFGTTLFFALILIELSDIVFAIDSVPAVLSITTDPFLAYTSNIFAVLGLRSLYFFLLCLHTKFVFLKKGILLLLFFIGAKMILIDLVPISTSVSLAVILTILLGSIGYSLYQSQKQKSQ